MVKIVQNFENFQKIPENSDDHDLETKYARNVKFGSKSAVLDTIQYFTNKKKKKIKN